jgi:hypothetical protein
LVAEGWYPTKQGDKIRDALIIGSKPGTMPAILNDIKAKDKPPTYVVHCALCEHILS